MVAAYLLTAALGVSDHPMVAPLVALLVVQLTLYKTVVHGIGKVVAVLAGVLVAVLVANVAGVTWWSLGAVVAGSIVVGKLLRLGPHLFEAPITAMLLLEVGATGGLGASPGSVRRLSVPLVGIAVSVLVAPPLYVQPAGEAIGELAHRMADFSRGFAEGLRGPWSREAADHWLREVRGASHGRGAGGSGGGAGRGERAAAPAGPQRPAGAAAAAQHAHRPGAGPHHPAHDRPGSAGSHLLHARGRAAGRLHAGQRAALADVLTTAAAAIDAVAPIAGADDPQQARSRVHALLADLDEQQQSLHSLLAVRPEQDQAAWKQHGALLSSIDRLSVEIATAASEIDPPAQPEAPLARQVRRWVDSMEAATARLAD